MPAASENKGMWRRRLVALTLCSLAAAPLLVLFYLLQKSVEQMSLSPLFAVEDWNVPRLTTSLMVGPFVAAPSIALIAGWMIWLARRDHDSFAISVLSGTAVSYLGCVITMLILVGSAPGLNIGNRSNVSEALIAILTGAALCCLYWTIAVRRERAVRFRRRTHDAAIRAME